jgi:AraC-like DNA-binding protein/mannose-6-phosphate isomerase-like protein (cupin superfamily)
MDGRLKTRTRLEMDLGKLGIRSVPVLGRYNYAHAMPGLEVHRHPGAMEICYLVRGRQTYEVGGRRFSLRGGDVFLTLPGEEHGTGGEPEEKGLLYWLTLRAPSRTGGFLLGLPPAESRALWKAVRGFSRRHFPGTPEMKNQLDAVTGLALRRASPLSRIAAGNLLVGFLLAVVSAHGMAVLAQERRRFADVFSWISSHLESPRELTVSRLAKVAGLSPSRFQAAFKQETGIPPAEFALRARITEASRRLARPGADVTSVAFDLGFSSSQYFASAFRRYTNASPREALKKRPG